MCSLKLEEEGYLVNKGKSTVAHICHGKTLFHGKTYFSTAKHTFLRQNLLFHGKTYFLTANLTFPRQNLLFHSKSYFSTAKVTFLGKTLYFHGKTTAKGLELNLKRLKMATAHSLHSEDKDSLRTGSPVKF